MFCPNCGAEQPNDASFCESCGESLSGESPPPPATAQPRSGLRTLLFAFAGGAVLAVAALLTCVVTGGDDDEGASPGEVTPTTAGNATRTRTASPSASPGSRTPGVTASASKTGSPTAAGSATQSSTGTPAVGTATAPPPTNTGVPSTSTQIPPTSTAIPPTKTSVPPTSTSIPPTKTPVPTATPTTPPISAVDVFGTVYFSIFGGPEETCGGCVVCFVGGGHTYTVTSGSDGWYEASILPGSYSVSYACPAIGGGTLWVPLGSITIPVEASYWVDIVTEGCL